MNLEKDGGGEAAAQDAGQEPQDAGQGERGGKKCQAGVPSDSALQKATAVHFVPLKCADTLRSGLSSRLTAPLRVIFRRIEFRFGPARHVMTAIVGLTGKDGGGIKNGLENSDYEEG